MNRDSSEPFNNKQQKQTRSTAAKSAAASRPITTISDGVFTHGTARRSYLDSTTLPVNQSATAVNPRSSRAAARTHSLAGSLFLCAFRGRSVPLRAASCRARSYLVGQATGWAFQRCRASATRRGPGPVGARSSSSTTRRRHACPGRRPLVASRGTAATITL